METIDTEWESFLENDDIVILIMPQDFQKMHLIHH